MEAAPDGPRQQPSFEIEGFEPISKLGTGGFGVVWKAKQARIDRLVAIKVSSTVLENEEDQLFFDRECESLGRLSGHPNVVQVYATGHLEDGRPYLVLEYIDGGTLTSRLRDDKIPYDEVRQLAIDLCDGLAHAHASDVLHRDIKPDNVFLRSTGAAVLGDFGIAQLLDTTKSRVGSMVGSLRYMAPDVLKGDRPTVSSDLYGVGITLHTAMSRQPPFSGTGDLVEQVMQRVLHTELVEPTTFGYPRELSDLVMTLLHKSPGSRPGSAKELANLFAALPETEPRRTPKPTTPPPAPVTPDASQQAVPANPATLTASPDELSNPADAKTILAATEISELSPDGSRRNSSTEELVADTDNDNNNYADSATTEYNPDEHSGHAKAPLGDGGTQLYATPTSTPDAAPLTATRVFPEEKTAPEGDVGPGGTRIFPATPPQSANNAATTPKPATEIDRPPAASHPPPAAPPVATPPPAQPRAVPAAPPPSPQREKTLPPEPTQIPPVPSGTTVLFEGVDYDSPNELAVAIAARWDSAIAKLADPTPTLFKEELTKAAHSWNRHQVSNVIVQFPVAAPRQQHQLLTDLLIELDPQQPPTYRGYQIGRDHLRHAHKIPPVVIDEIRRSDILIRWRRNRAMAGIVEFVQRWEHQISEYDYRNQALRVSDQYAVGNLLAATGNEAAASDLKKRLLTDPNHSKAGRQRWWAELYSAESVPALLLAQHMLPVATAKTDQAEVETAKQTRGRSVRAAATIAVGVITLTVSALAASAWHAGEGPAVDRFTGGWIILAAIPFLFFWVGLATSNKRGVVAGGCLGSVAWLVYGALLTSVGAVITTSERLDPRTSAFGLFVTLAVVTVPLASFMMHRRLTQRLKQKRTPDMATYLST